ncbi:MAG: 3'-5' exonuclease, partial [Clostridiales bacterium]|nr:3'-5' exonuclease [Clostridiales bacterium]
LLAARNGVHLWDVVSDAGRYPDLQKAAGKLNQFADLIRGLRKQAGEMSLVDFYDAVCADSGYAVALEAKNTVEDRTRLENVRELGSSIQSYLDNSEAPSLAGFLDEIALYTDLDSHDPNEDCSVMMTMHSAKGLEFPVVFVVGAEEGIFPGLRSIGDEEEMEEERRLCYVAMTRAKERLYMTCASQRMLYGRTSANRPSRFLGEIPPERVERSGRPGCRMDSRLSESEWRPERELYRQEKTPGYSGRTSGYGDRGYTAPAASRGPAASRSGPVRAASAPLPDFQKGQMVRHKAFGTGMILTVTKMGGDALIEVAFDNVGTKKLMLKSAAQYMEKL